MCLACWLFICGSLVCIDKLRVNLISFLHLTRFVTRVLFPFDAGYFRFRLTQFSFRHFLSFYALKECQTLRKYFLKYQGYVYTSKSGSDLNWTRSNSGQRRLASRYRKFDPVLVRFRSNSGFLSKAIQFRSESKVDWIQCRSEPKVDRIQCRSDLLLPKFRFVVNF